MKKVFGNKEVFMKLKELVKMVKDWCLDMAKVLWEDYLKDNLLDQIKELAKDGVNKVETFVNSDNYDEKKEAVINYIFTKIKLPIYLKLFKGIIKSILSKEVDKVIDKLLGKAKDIIA